MEGKAEAAQKAHAKKKANVNLIAMETADAKIMERKKAIAWCKDSKSYY